MHYSHSRKEGGRSRDCQDIGDDAPAIDANACICFTVITVITGPVMVHAASVESDRQ